MATVLYQSWTNRNGGNFQPRKEEDLADENGKDSEDGTLWK